MEKSFEKLCASHHANEADSTHTSEKSYEDRGNKTAA